MAKMARIEQRTTTNFENTQGRIECLVKTGLSESYPNHSEFLADDSEVSSSQPCAQTPTAGLRQWLVHMSEDFSQAAAQIQTEGTED